MPLLGISTSIVTSAWFTLTYILPMFFFFFSLCGAEPRHELTFPVVYRGCCTADQVLWMLTYAYLTLYIFKVLYFCELFKWQSYLHSKTLFIHFSCLSVPWWVFFLTTKGIWYSEIFTFSITFVNLDICFKFPWKSFCSDFVCCKMENKSFKNYC